jgi:hypothetical protein
MLHVRLQMTVFSQGTGYLTSLSKYAGGWLNSNLINWINAMVTAAPYGSLDEVWRCSLDLFLVNLVVWQASMYWQQHLNGASWADVPPVNPHQMLVSLYPSLMLILCKCFDIM